MDSIRTWRFILIYILLALAGVYVYTRAEASVPVNKPLNLFPQRSGDWVMTGSERFDSRVLEQLLPTDYISRGYHDADGNHLALYIGYHDGGPGSGPIHSPRQCLPGSGWNQLTAERREIEIDGEIHSYVGAVYQKNTQKQLFLYWYQVRDQMLTNEYALKYQMMKNSFTSNRRDATFVRLSVLVRNNDYDTAYTIGEKFIRDFITPIHDYLPR